MTDPTEAQAMLSLAALSYRGFEDTALGFIHIERLRQALSRGFEDLAGIAQWELAWEPAPRGERRHVFQPARVADRT
jgi:hypothetical protein